MAVIGKIREQSTLVLIIIGGAIMAFVLSDLFSSGGSVFNETRDLAEVNSHKISVQEFEVRVQNAYENYQMNSQGEALDERTKSSIREQVWNDMLQDIILGEEMQELGLTVTTEELFDMVQGNNPHPQIRQAFTNPETGRFNPSDVVRFIQNLDQDPNTKKQWIAFEKNLKKNQLREKYATLVKKGIYFTTAEGQSSFSDVNTRMNLQYVMSPYSSISDDKVEISEADLKEYYDEHKHIYEQDASVKVNYAFFPVDPSDDDQEFARKWAFDTYEKFLTVKDDSGFVNMNSDSPMDYRYYSLSNLPEGFNRGLDTAEVGTVLAPQLTGNVWRIQKLRNIKIAPDSVKARHILINNADRTAEAAKAIADSLKLLLENAADFEELAIANSDDVASAKQGGDVGWFTEGVMVKAFNDSSFSSEVGEIKIAESQYGYHVIEVTDRTEPVKKMQIAVIDRSVEPSRETYEEIFNKANSFSINANDKESFDAAIKEGNIIRREATIGAYDNEISGLSNSRDLVRWIHDANEGDVSEAIDVEDAFVVVQVEAVNKEGIAPLEKVKDAVRAQVMMEKKGEVLKEQMSGASSLEQLASKLNLKIQSANGVNMNNPQLGNSFEGKVVGKAATLEQGQMSVPINGMSGVYVVKVDRLDKPQEVNVETGKRILAQSYMMRIDNNSVFSALKDEAEIVDNRSKFY